MANLQTQILALESSGLIRLLQDQPDLEYLFKHALIQDAAYNSLLKADRKRLHRVVGETLEAAFQDRLDEIAPLLGQHFDLANDEPRALKYLTLAGDAAAHAYANAEATLHYTRASEIAQRDPSTLSQTIQHLHTQLGHVLELDGKYVEAMNAYNALEAIAQRQQDRHLELVALMAQAKVLATPNSLHNPAQAKIVLARATQLADDLGEREIAARSSWNLMLLYVFGGEDLRPALAYGQRSIALAREFNLREQLAFSLNDIFYIYFSLGQSTEGLKAATEARDLWIDLGNRPMLANALTIMGEAYLERGDFTQALNLATEARTIAQAINNVYGEVTTLHASAITHYLKGDWDKAFAEINLSFPKAEQVGHAISSILLRCELAYMYGVAGQMDRGLVLIDQAIEFNQANFSFWQSHPYTTRARLYALHGDTASAAAALAQAQQLFKPFRLQIFNQIALTFAEIEVALCQNQFQIASQRAALLAEELTNTQRQGFLPYTLWLQGKALRLAQNETEATEVLQQALVLSEKLGEQYIRWQILVLLGKLKPDHSYTERARESLKGFIARLPNELHDSFVAQSYIKTLLNTQEESQ